MYSEKINGLILDLITSDLTVNEHTVPDISVGKTWGDYWMENNLNEDFGSRITYEHNYPSYYPTSQKVTPKNLGPIPMQHWQNSGVGSKTVICLQNPFIYSEKSKITTRR